MLAPRMGSTPIVVVTLVAALAGCTPHDSARPAPSANAAGNEEMHAQMASVIIDTDAGPQRFTVELAATTPARTKGLMFREHMDDDAGMLFLFEEQGPQSFWMKNTRIPLDMIFIDAGGTIAGIVEDAEPLTLTSRGVDKPSRYVLELNGGTSRKRGITAGQRVRFEGVPVDLVDARVLSAPMGGAQ